PSTRALSRGRKPRSAGALLLAVISVTAQMAAVAAATGWAPGLAGASVPKANMAARLLRGIDCGGVAAAGGGCVAAASLHPEVARVVVPTGSKQCPDSGFGASC